MIGPRGRGRRVRDKAGGEGPMGEIANPSFAVACLARETPALLAAFVGHYLSLGAQEVHVMLDGTATPDHAALAADPRDRLRVIDDAAWQAALGGHARHIGHRQSHAYGLAHAETGADWLFVTDADEFLIARTPVREMLARIPAAVDAFSLPSAEAVWGPEDDIGRPFGSTWFRRAVYTPGLWQLLGVLFYGRDARVFRRCVLSHTRGKHFVRSGARFDRIGLHFSRRDGQDVTVSFRDRPGLRAGNEIAHFDAGSFERWHEKFRRRYSGEIRSESMKRGQRLAQMRALDRAFGTGQAASRARAMALFRRFYAISAFQARLMRGLGLAFQMRLIQTDHPEAGKG